MKTEHILLNEDPQSTLRTLPEKNPGGAATPESGVSVETRKGTRFARPGNQAEPVCKGDLDIPTLEPVTTEVLGFSQETKDYLARHLQRVDYTSFEHEFFSDGE